MTSEEEIKLDERARRLARESRLAPMSTQDSLQQILDPEHERWLSNSGASDKKITEMYAAIEAYIARKVADSQIEQLRTLLDAEIVKSQYHNMVVGKIQELKAE